MVNDKEQNVASAYGKVIAKAWRDPSFKAKLIADPQGTLRQAGVSIPAGVTVKVVENTGTQFHFVLPAMPSGALSDVELDHASGGLVYSAKYSACRP
jgi:Nitrile hydratase, alpha chain